MSNRTVLVIEDDRALSEIVSYNLEQHGFQVSTAFDGQSGLNVALREPPEIILLDVMLPVLDGIEVCRLDIFRLEECHRYRRDQWS